MGREDPSAWNELETARVLAAPRLEGPEDTLADLEVARAGSAAGLEKLWTRFVPGLQVSLAGKIHSVIDARLRAKLQSEISDLLQETMLKASRALLDFEYRGPGSLLGWLRTIALNELRNRIEFWDAERRDAGREHELRAASETFPAGAEPAAASPGPSTLAEIDEQRQNVAKALESLDVDLREILFFRFFSGASWAEIAERLGYPSADAVRMDCVRRALPALAIALTA